MYRCKNQMLPSTISVTGWGDYFIHSIAVHCIQTQGSRWAGKAEMKVRAVVWWGEE
jgi:hypothetical protein